MARHERATLALGLLAFCAGVTVLLVALALSFYIESSPAVIADIRKAQRIAIPAVGALVAGVVALNARRRDWGFVVACVGAAAGVLAVLLTFLLPGGD